MKKPGVVYATLGVIGYILAIWSEFPPISWVVYGWVSFLVGASIVFRTRVTPLILGIGVLFGAYAYYEAYDARNVSQLTLDYIIMQMNQIEATSAPAKSNEVAMKSSSADREQEIKPSEWNAELSGKLASPVEIDGDRARFVLEADQIRFKQSDPFLFKKERIQIQVRLLAQSEQTEAASWRRGDALTLSGVLRSPPTARNFGGFDYRRYLRLQHIHWLFAVKGTAAGTWRAYVPKLEAIYLLREIDRLRATLSHQIDAIFARPYAGFMKAMLIGETQDLDPERFQQFSALGLTHILAISGLNIAVFLGALIWLLRCSRCRESTYLWIAITSLPIYMLVTGASPSVVRAGLMAMVVCLATWRKKKISILHVIISVAFFMLIWNPYYLLDVSFQLSFFVTIGLILGTNPIKSLLPKMPNWLANTIAVTWMAQLVSFPISIYYFNQFSLLSGIANACIVPVMSLLVYPAGLLAVGLSFFSIELARLLANGIEALIRLIFLSTDWMQMWRFLQLLWPTPSVIWIIAYLCFLIAGMMLLMRWKQQTMEANHQDSFVPDWHVPTETNDHHAFRNSHGSHLYMQFWRKFRTALLAIVMCIGFVSLLLIGYEPTRFQTDGLVSMIDIGQGDAILIRTPQGKHLLIDGGGTLSFAKNQESWQTRQDPYEVGAKLLVPLLKKRGVHALDAVILTHLDLDHSGGLQAVAESIPIRAFYFNGTLKSNEKSKQLFQTLLAQHVPLYAVHQGKTLAMDTSTQIHFLFPLQSSPLQSSPHIVNQEKQNEWSIAMLLEMAETRWLFTGDMEQSAELAVIQNFKNQQSMPQIDFLKVAHHGSKTSTSREWLQFWQPRYALISVGSSNRYGHPAPIVLSRLQQFQIPILRTDLLGEIQIRVRNGQITVRTKL